MISRRVASAARPLLSSARRPSPLTTAGGPHQQVRYLTQADIDDPNMNGGYVNPPAQKRQFRDPYGDWWDKQERRNFGEPIHEDNDTLTLFSLHEYTHTTAGRAFAQLSVFVAAVFGLAGIVSIYYPDRPSVPREFPGGLEAELGGPEALAARKEGDPLD
ncbi:MAG: hypothetical protein M1825_000415 [Sarcosagium campestre]|nr:MAG: hypothetical protein M1825_000415 [Sarcosagium campestre]